VSRIGLAVVAVAVFATSATAQSTGQWVSMPDLPFFPTGVHLLPNGTVMFYGGDNQGSPPGQPATVARAWDPATGGTSLLAAPGYDVFCVGVSHLGDGRLFFARPHRQQRRSGERVNVRPGGEPLDPLSRHERGPLVSDHDDARERRRARGGRQHRTTPVHAAELWDPVTGRWTTLASQRVGRF
jgi:hypothetical protein